MSTPGELVAVMASALGVPQATVIVHDRNLVAAGLRSKHGRGRGAAHVNARDAAHLLIAILGSRQVRDSADTVARFSKTKVLRNKSTPSGYRGTELRPLKGLSTEHSFVDALEYLFAFAAGEVCGGEKLPPLLEIGAISPGTMGDVRMAGFRHHSVVSIRYALKAGSSPQSAKSEGDLQEYRRVSVRTFQSVGMILQGESK